MIVAFYALAGLMAAAGLAALVQGIPFIRVEIGWTMVIAGTVSTCAGALLAGTAAVLGRLARIERALGAVAATAFPPAFAAAGPMTAGPATVSQATTSPAAAALAAAIGATPRRPPAGMRTIPAGGLAPGFAEPPPLDIRPTLDPEEPAAPGAPPSAAHAASVVGTYASGGNAYVMFSDGSIEADTPRGRYRFDSLDELKAFAAASGEAAPAA